MGKRNSLMDVLLQRHRGKDSATFWQQYQLLQPSHDVFTTHAADLQHRIPFVLHGDEGRGQKKKPVLIMQIHPVLGRGSLVPYLAALVSRGSAPTTLPFAQKGTGTSLWVRLVQDSGFRCFGLCVLGVRGAFRVFVYGFGSECTGCMVVLFQTLLKPRIPNP